MYHTRKPAGDVHADIPILRAFTETPQRRVILGNLALNEPPKSSPPLASHPSSRLSCPKCGGKAKTGRAHGKITNQIPDQASNLHDGREEG